MRSSIIALVMLTLLAGNLAHAQTEPPAPPAENLAAARELVQVMKATDTFRVMLPSLVNSMKAAIVQNRPEVEKGYDAMTPRFIEAANMRVNELADQIAGVYARHFTVDEIHQITQFYRSPTGQKMIAEQPAIARETLAYGQQLGRTIATDIAEQMRKNGNAN
jgi:uncharacterized protein